MQLSTILHNTGIAKRYRDQRKWLIFKASANIFMIKKIIYVLAVIFLLTGCSIIGRYYIRNLTNQDAYITILMDKKIELDDIIESKFLWEPEIMKIKYSLYNKLKRKLPVELTSTNHLQFKIPPNSTAYIGVGINTHLINVKSITIEQGDKQVELGKWHNK